MMNKIIPNNLKIMTSGGQDEAKQMAKIALDNRLFVGGWLMWDFYHSIIDGNESIEISLAYDDSNPIGACVFYNKYCVRWGNLVSVFVKPKYRRNGVGTNLIFTAKKNRDCFAIVGHKQISPRFFKNHNIGIIY